MRQNTSPAPPGDDGGDQDRSSPWSGFDDELPPDHEARPATPPAPTPLPPPESAPGPSSLPLPTQPPLRPDVGVAHEHDVDVPVGDEESPKRLVGVGLVDGG